MRQLEKKYLAKENVLSIFPLSQASIQHFTEFYTVVKVCKEVRYSKEEERYFKTMKTGIVGHKELHKEEISQSKYQKALETKRVGEVIEKERYELQIDDPNTKLYFDKYKKPLEHLNIIEANFQTRSAQMHFTLPHELQPLITKEVTKDERYQYKNLALLGDPIKNPYNIYAIFKDIEVGRLTDIQSAVFEEMKSSDALRIKLFKMFVDLKVNHDKIIQTDATQGIETFHNKVRKSRILLKEYQKIFDKKITPKVLKHLKLMESALKKYKDLCYIQNILLQMDDMLTPDDFRQFTTQIENEISKERHQIKKFFTTREFAIIFKQYELLLRENNKSFYSIDAQTSIKNSLHDKINAKFSQTLRLCEKYEGCQDKESYVALKSQFRTLSHILNAFPQITKNSDNIKLQKSVKKTYSTLSELQEIKKKRLTLLSYLEHAKVKTKLFKSLKSAIISESEEALKTQEDRLSTYNEKLASLNSHFKQ